MTDTELIDRLNAHQAPAIQTLGGHVLSLDKKTQTVKVPHLRNMYQKVGMFGMPLNDAVIPGDGVFMGDQIRGFGFLHDDSVDTLFRFHSIPQFNFPLGDPQREIKLRVWDNQVRFSLPDKDVFIINAAATPPD